MGGDEDTGRGEVGGGVGIGARGGGLSDRLLLACCCYYTSFEGQSAIQVKLYASELSECRGFAWRP